MLVEGTLAAATLFPVKEKGPGNVPAFSMYIDTVSTAETLFPSLETTQVFFIREPSVFTSLR
jgi:hypothetical protein